uniref:Ig-like domain-containing protein n=1 Tax=Oncorhynchus kisutch TaxID=8019 RepID=A0A8C7FKH6_ONCKI
MLTVVQLCSHPIAAGPSTTLLQEILWKHGVNKGGGMEHPDRLQAFSDYKGRTTLNTTTGEIAIRQLTKQLSGVYEAECMIGGEIQTFQQRVKFIAVPKPTITYTCNSNKTSCILTSEGNATGAERVTYSWKVGEGAWEVIGKQLIVSKSDTGKSTNSYKYICKLKNSVSGEVSEPVGEVFGPGEWTLLSVLILSIDMLVTLLIRGSRNDNALY